MRRGLLGACALCLAWPACDSEVIVVSRGGAGGAAASTVASGAAQSSTSTSVSSPASSTSGTQPVCGDGVVDGGECCDDGSNNGAPGDPCNKDCTCVSCKQQKIFAGVVSNTEDPTVQTDPPNVGSVWSYNGIKGYQAGMQMCQAIGADHPCNFTEVVAADQKGELAGVPQGLTFWLQRTTNAMDDLQPNKACTQDSDCNQFAGDAASVCDPAHKLCAFQPGPGGNCNDWQYPGGDWALAEWFESVSAPMTTLYGVSCGDAFCRKPGGSLLYHFERDTTFDGKTANPCDPHDPPQLGCGGPCGNLSNARAILCCYAPCK